MHKGKDKAISVLNYIITQYAMKVYGNLDVYLHHF
jgi:hypothetical protein